MQVAVPFVVIRSTATEIPAGMKAIAPVLYWYQRNKRHRLVNAETVQNKADLIGLVFCQHYLKLVPLGRAHLSHSVPGDHHCGCGVEYAQIEHIVYLFVDLRQMS